MPYFFRVLLILGICFSPIVGVGQRITLDQRTVVEPLQVPWEILWGPDDWIWFTERDGNIGRVHPETGEVRFLITLPRAAQVGEGGVLGLVLHPSFNDSPYVYVAYNYFAADSTMPLKVERYRYNGDSLVEPIILLDDVPGNTYHDGCRLVIYENKLWVSTGDAGHEMSSQDDRSLSGKILRMNLDGSIPEDNPWPNSLVWSKGHRNPQGLIFGPSGLLYSSEHGSITDDEINVIERGRNYGWPFVEGYCDRDREHAACRDSNVREPVHAWTPTVAVSGMVYYGHDRIPEWKNSLLCATLKDESVWQLKLSDDGRAVVEVNRYHIQPVDPRSPVRRLRDLCISPDGRVFVSTSYVGAPRHRLERIFELIRTGTEPFTLTLIAPVDDSLVTEENVDLKWQEISKIAVYQVQLARDSTFVINLVDSIMRDASVTVTVIEDSTTYYWRARESRTDGPWTEVRRFHTRLPRIAPVLHRPAMNTLVRVLPVRLEWVVESTLRGFEIEVTNNASPSPSRLLRTDSLHLQLDSLEAGATYTWRVRPLDRRGDWSSSSTFSYVPEDTTGDSERIVSMSSSLVIGATDFTFYVDATQHVRLRVLDGIGRTVSEVVDRVLQKGWYLEPWRPENLPYGMYWYQYLTGASTQSGRLLYVSQK